jgi:hypothetical protein
MRFIAFLLSLVMLVTMVACCAEKSATTKPDEAVTEEAKPAEGGEEAKPAEGGEEAKPAEGGEEAKPAEGGEEKPAEGGEEKPAE